MAKPNVNKQDKIILDNPVSKERKSIDLFGTETAPRVEEYNTKPKDQSYSTPNINLPSIQDSRIQNLVNLLQSGAWEKYITELMILHDLSLLAAVNRSGQLVKYNPEEPIINACAVTIVPEDYFSGHKSNPDSDQFINVDSSLVSEIDNLPSFFLQGTTLISKSALLTTGTGGNQRSWHQLPNITTAKAIMKLTAVLPYLENFGGKIIM